MRAMPNSRRDVVRLCGLAASALALPALADTNPPKPMRLLILGGTGFIGPYQVRYALSRGHRARAKPSASTAATSAARSRRASPTGRWR
jgi:hypothetical protein